jgi:hypothetical protein
MRSEIERRQERSPRRLTNSTRSLYGTANEHEFRAINERVAAAKEAAYVVHRATR